VRVVQTNIAGVIRARNTVVANTRDDLVADPMINTAASLHVDAVPVDIGSTREGTEAVVLTPVETEDLLVIEDEVIAEVTMPIKIFIKGSLFSIFFLIIFYVDQIVPVETMNTVEDLHTVR